METHRVYAVAGQKPCRLCHQLFSPHPKVKGRQQVCDRQACQRLRQKLNHYAWLEKNPVDYQKWYQDYGQAWRQAHPEYLRQYRQRQRLHSHSARARPEREKKEQLTFMETSAKEAGEKKEQLSYEFYLLKAKELVLMPVAIEKKEQLAICFT